MTVELWLVRHGETEWTETGRFCGRSDPDLSEGGRAQARALREILKVEGFDSFVSSPWIRAVETARLAYGEPRLDERLAELDFGELEGARWHDCAPEIRAELLAYDTFAAPGGESVKQLSDRVSELLGELGPGRHLLVTHGGVIRLLLGRVGITEYPAPGSLSRVELDAGIPPPS